MSNVDTASFITSFSISLSYILGCLGIILDIPCVIFLFNEFRYPKSPLRSAYFVILSVGLMVLVIEIIIRLLFPGYVFSSELTWISVVSSIYQWFSQNALGYWIFILACNRCSALIAPDKYNKVGFLIYNIFIFNSHFRKIVNKILDALFKTLDNT